MKLLRIHCFQHVDYEDLGCIYDWCKAKGYTISYTKFFESVRLPQPDDYDWLIVMGGPMGVYETEKYDWLTDEKKAIQAAILKNKTVIGICLGAQLIADALGAKVYKNPEKEIGWFDISFTGQALKYLSPETTDANLNVFHWHGDTFELPENAIPLAYSEACKNQAFIYKNKVIGLQFHFEVTEQSIRAMVENGKHELTGGNYIQTEKEILAQKATIESNNRKMFQILDHLAGLKDNAI